MPAFGAGLTVCAHLVRWGDRVTPLGESDAAMPPVKKSALEMVNEIRKRKADAHVRSADGMRNVKFIEAM
jgi:3-oxoacyl-[acyl-carrier-protein] synthase-3